jgi:hypothetical protein
MTRQSGSTPRTDDCVVRPVRFTADVAAMRDFLGLLGLAPRVESQRGGWVDLVAGAGMVALHDAAGSATGGRPGQTNLSFEGADLDALAARLSDAGWHDATIWDEAYGRVLSVTDPAGERLWVDGYNDDDYGYDVHRPERDGRWLVMPVRSTSVVPEYVRFLGCFGLEPYADRPAPVVGGHVGMVRLDAGPAAVLLGLATAEPLEEVAERLRVAGHDTAVADSDLTVIDPDGQVVVVHPRQSA